MGDESSVVKVDPEDRLRKIRSILRDAEKEMDGEGCDQIPILRKVFVDVIMAAGPQKSGVRRKRKIKNEA